MPRDTQVAGGHKANLKNPHTSLASKLHSKRILEEQFGGGYGVAIKPPEGLDYKNPNNVAGGLKATLKNPNVSPEAKESARQRLKEMGYTDPTCLEPEH